jgi:hypothetical protein
MEVGMSRLAVRILAVGAVIALLGVVSYAVAGDGPKQFAGSPMTGLEENPDLSTTGVGSFDARLSDDGSSLEYTLTYSGTETTVTQAHVHLGKPAINGGISYFLCTNLGNGPAGTQACPAEGTVTGTITAADVIGPAGQGIAAGEFDEIVAAMRAGHTYANVHTTGRPGGEIRAQLRKATG